MNELKKPLEFYMFDIICTACDYDDQVGISIFKILIQITRPKTVMLGNIPGTDIYRNLHHYKEAMRVPGFLILSIEAPINFANTTYLNERLILL